MNTRSEIDDAFYDFCEEEISVEPTLEDAMREIVRRLGLKESDTILIELATYFRTLGWQLCSYAVEQAEREGKHKWASVRRILKRWKDHGICTVEEAEAFDQKRREEMGLRWRP